MEAKGYTRSNHTNLIEDINEVEERFYSKLHEVLEVCKEGLLFRIHRLENVPAKVAPILYGDSTKGCYGATGFSLNPEEPVGKIFGKRTSISLGYVGLNETIRVLYGKEVFNNSTMIAKAEEIMKFLYDHTVEWSNDTNYSFSVYGTPSESLAHRFEEKDKMEFGIIPKVTSRTWYSNSFHTDVEQKCDAFEKLDHESNFINYSSGGFTTMIDAHSLKNNNEALETLWNYSYENSKIGYMSVNVREDRCYKCGNTGEFVPTVNGYECPFCGNKDLNEMEVIRRISGYLSALSSRLCNKGKKDEIDSRVIHL